MTQEVIIKSLIVNPTVEVMPLLKIIPQTDWFVIIAMIFAPIIAALSTYFLTIFYQSQNRKGQEKSIKIAMKYELFNNFYEMKDVGRVATSAKKMFDDSSKPIYPQDFSKIIYSPPLFTAFEAMISNNLLAAVVNEEKKVFFIYSFLREYDLAYKQLLEEIDRVFMTARDGVDLMPYQKKEVSRKLHSLIHWADTLEKAFEGGEEKLGYLDSISFLSREEWEDFKKRNPLGEK